MSKRHPSDEMVTDGWREEVDVWTENDVWGLSGGGGW